MHKPAALETLAPGLHRLELESHTLAPFRHTNSFIVEDKGVAVLIDAGFYEAQSLTLLKNALAFLRVSFLKAVLLTHSHQDHIEGLTLVQKAYPDLPIYVHPKEYANVETFGKLKVLNDRRRLMVGNSYLEALWTPGHSPGHVSFYLPDDAILLVGDLLAAQGSTWVGLPEGNINDYLQSIQNVQSLKLKKLAPSHGPVVLDPYSKLHEVYQHRLARLEQILSALKTKPLRLAELCQIIYPEVPDSILPMAKSSLLALLEKLMLDTKVMHLGSDEEGPYAVF